MKIARPSASDETISIKKSNRYELAISDEWVPERYMNGDSGEKRINWNDLISDTDSIIQRTPATAYDEGLEMKLELARIGSFSKATGFPNAIELVFEPKPYSVGIDFETGLSRITGFSAGIYVANVFFVAATSTETREELKTSILL